MRQQYGLPMRSGIDAGGVGSPWRLSHYEACGRQELVKLRHIARARNYAIQDFESVSDQHFGGFCGRISAICPIVPVGDAIGDL